MTGIRKYIDFGGVSINATNGTTVAGIYDKFESNDGYELVVGNLKVGSTVINEQSINCYLDGTDYKFTAGHYNFVIDDDDLVTPTAIA